MATQSVQLTIPGVRLNESTQTRHESIDEPPGSPREVPAGQAAHCGDPGAGEYIPDGQSVQTKAESALEYWPRSQGSQA